MTEVIYPNQQEEECERLEYKLNLGVPPGLLSIYLCPIVTMNRPQTKRGVFTSTLTSDAKYQMPKP